MMTRTGMAGVLVAITLLCACSEKSQLPPAAMESSRETNSGRIVGFADRHDTWTWLGIPYAEPPIGDLRWRAPRPRSSWQGELPALSFPPMCPQFPIPMVNDSDQAWLGDEDCLYLNVSAPRSWSAGDPPLPVMVWIHGGGNTVGSTDLYPAVRNLAALEGVITVSIHYRLGILGWFSHPALRELASSAADASGNFGTLDTIAALAWVRDNIRTFGGDPDNVTVFGESAGGMNTFALLLSPLARGLFHRAISQSGMLITSPLSQAENLRDAPEPGSENSSSELLLRLVQTEGLATDRGSAERLLAAWDSAATMAYLRAKSPYQLLQQMQGTEMGLYRLPNMLRDGVVLPKGDPLMQLQAGNFNRVPVILGTNRDEMKTMMLRNEDYVNLLFGMFPQVRDQAMYDRVTGYGSKMWKAVGADEPASAMTDAGHEDVFVYRFDWDQVPSRFLMDFSSLLGAAHSFELPFVFSDLDNEMTYLPFDMIDEDNMPGAAPLASAMSSYWVNFARSGRPTDKTSATFPAWQSWREGGYFLVLDTHDRGGIRMETGALNRATVFRQLAQDRAGMGGPEGVCTAYNNLFATQAPILGFTSACPLGKSCAGSAENFCGVD